MASNHPLPTPPGHDQRPVQQRQRAKSSFSFRSHRSHNSSGSGHKIDLHETHEEKDSKRLHSKADPSMAITEAEPSAVAAGVKSQLAPLRAIQHRDNQGNPIADPDKSNPTRSRWERPLDTIRGFEAAIDGNYSRKSYIRPDQTDVGSTYVGNRRSSYYGGTQVTQDDRRYQNGYYGRSQSYRPESQYTNGGYYRPDSYYNGENGPGPSNGVGPSNGYYPNRARYPRTASEPHFNNFNNAQNGVYPGPGNQQSYETATTPSGSGSPGDPAGYSTDPSSESSSVDRVGPLPQPKEIETYGFNGFGNAPQYAPPGSGLLEQQAQRQGNGYQHQGPPPPPHKDVGSRAPIRLGETSGNAGGPPPTPAKEKRKSWLGKKFGR